MQNLAMVIAFPRSGCNFGRCRFQLCGEVVAAFGMEGHCDRPQIALPAATSVVAGCYAVCNIRRTGCGIERAGGSRVLCCSG